MKFAIIDTGLSSATDNMRIDQELLETLPPTPYAVLHLYGWKGSSATFGYFCQPEKFLNAKALQKYQLQLAKRPTGGGIIFHDFDLTFSILLSASHPYFSLNTLENYRFVNNIIIDAISQFTNQEGLPTLLSEETKSKDPNARHFCMAKPTIYDVILNGRKLAGGAQRRTKQGFLHQGSIALTLPSEEFLEDVLIFASGITEAMKSSSYPLLPASYSLLMLQNAKKRLTQCLIDQFTAKLQQ